MKRALDRVKNYFKGYGTYVIAEFKDYLTYLNAFIIGAIVNYFSGHGFPGLSVPYLVPLAVQVISKSMVKYKNRHMRRLIQLPSEREDPAFIMGEGGDILLATGITGTSFDFFNVKNISDFIEKEGFSQVARELEKNRSSYRIDTIYSPCSEKWYDIRLKPVNSASINREYLAWFIDVSDKKNYEDRIMNLLRFSSSVHARLKDGMEREEIYAILAEYVLKSNYHGVFMSRVTRSGLIAAYCFKMKNDLPVRSEPVILKPDSETAEILLRKGAPAVIETCENYASPDDFLRLFTFHSDILDFLEEPVVNFVSFHDERVSLIGFNKIETPQRYDLIMMEIMANNIRTLLDIVDTMCYTLNRKDTGEE